MNYRTLAFGRALMRSTGPRFWWTIALIVLLPLTEGAGLALLLPTLETAGLGLRNQGEANHLAGLVWRAFALVGAHPGFLALLMLYVIVIGLRAILDRSRLVSVWTMLQDFQDDLRRRLYRALAGADWRFISRSRLADFGQALTGGVYQSAVCAESWTKVAGDLAVGVIYLGVALLLSPPITRLAFGIPRPVGRTPCSEVTRHWSNPWPSIPRR